MSDVNDRIEDPDLTDIGAEDVDLDETVSIDEVQEDDAEEINPVFGDDQEVIADNLNYDE
ncbi:hypothetical protein [Herbiconiux flava]|uniref:Uncharacterized protein n=1 Tax=Herbiconiux flava TaxID=881268 RepID=A0A852SM51_9MICO|nr:hypothetical protein [Herbiconiux flava]NYD69979.1 hypothetical protein [Herbiconiux flava]GLK16729.1 hypothetical protein GCM10017602_12110 [Herbiconiux flava]